MLLPADTRGPAENGCVDKSIGGTALAFLILPGRFAFEIFPGILVMLLGF